MPLMAENNMKDEIKYLEHKVKELEAEIIALKEKHKRLKVHLYEIATSED